tara:strand:- start:432 stop:950 length:519 start_codon:yes stop_codon:yes gene_type:complete
MKKLKKLFLLFSITLWKQIYLLINSFITGNVFAKTNLGGLGENTDIGPTVRFGNYPENIFIGAQCSLGIENHIYAGPNSKITIGDNTMIGPFAFLTTEPFSMTKENPNTAHSGHEGDITIGQNVRIGAHSILLPGIKIGNGSSVGAGSVVTKDVPENTIFAGNPAKLIKAIS